MSGARPSGTVTFLFTDIEGSTRLWEQFPQEMPDALTQHDEILRSSIEAAQGYTFSAAGDSFAAAFGTVGAAVSAARELQGRLHAEPWPPGVSVQVRIGIHTGEADERAGNYFGPTLNRAARLMAAGHGGQVLLSATSAAFAPTALLTDLGVHRLRDLGEPEHIWQLGDAGFPALRVSDAADVRLPEDLTSFVGRSAELGELATKVATNRLTTIIGPGGMGKTRLALRTAWHVHESFPDGVWFCGLADIDADHAESVPTAVGEAAAVRRREGLSMTDTLVEWIASRHQLLVLDNCEHVVEASAGLLQELLANCPRLHVLTTSRRPLGIAAETQYRAGPLDVEAATTLFLDRLGETKRGADGGTLTDAVVALCSWLDGIPLAIELAAARCRALDPAQLLDRLKGRPEILTDRTRTDRHRSLTAVLSWSSAELNPEAVVALRRCAIFRGGFDLEAFEAIGTDEALDEADVLDAVTDLVDAGLLQTHQAATGRRFHLLEPVRQYAEGLLDTSELTDLGRRHCRWYAGLAHQIGLGCRSDLSRWIDIAEADFANLRAAHRAALGGHDEALAVQIVSGLWLYGWQRLVVELGDWCDETLSSLTHPDPGLEIEALVAAMASWLQHRRFQEVLDAQQRVTELADPQEHGDAMAIASWCVGWAHLNSEDQGAAYDAFRAAASLAQSDWCRTFTATTVTMTEDELPRDQLEKRLRQSSNDGGLAWFQLWNSEHRLFTEGVEATLLAVDEAIGLAERLGATHALGANLWLSGFLRLFVPDPSPDEVLPRIARSLALFSRLRTEFQLWGALEVLGQAFAALGHPDPAMKLWASIDEHGGRNVMTRFRPMFEPHASGERRPRQQATDLEGAITFAKATLAELDHDR